MKNKYDIECLIKTFEEHHQTSESLRKITLECNPDSEWAKDDFSISKALKTICMEIQKLKDNA